MFSENHKISGRQAGRFFILCSLGTGGLTIPQILAKTTGTAGIYSIILGIFLLVLYLHMTGKIYKKSCLCGKNRSRVYKMLEKAINNGYLVIFAVSGSFLLVQQSALVKKMLLEKMPVWLLSGIFLLVCAYGALNGIEDLARISEILFYLIMALMIVLFFVTRGNVPVETFSETFVRSIAGMKNEGEQTGSIVSWINMIWKGAIKILPFGLSFLLMALHYEDFADLKKGTRGVFRGLIFFGGFLGILYFFCVGVFGVNLMKQQVWSLVDLMKGVNLPGGLFGKVDAFFSMVFILGIFFTVSQILILWVQSLKKIAGRWADKWSDRWSDKCFLLSGILALYAGSLWLGSYNNAEKFFGSFMEHFGLWLLLAGPVFQGLWLIFSGKKASFKAIIMILCLSASGVALSGCSPSLEQREYVLALGMEAGEKGYRVTYAFPDLSKVSDQGGSIENRTSYRVDVKSLFQAKSIYGEKTDKEPDYAHLKAVVVEQNLTESEEFWHEFIALGLDGTLSRDVKIFLCENGAGELLDAAAAENGSAGIYLESLCKNARILKDKEVLSVGDLCFFATETSGEMVRAKAENLVLPVLTVEEERPTISRIIKEFY